MRRLLESLSEAREIHVPLKELPSSLRDALKRVNYHAQDVGVVAQDKVIPNPYAGEGQKGFVLVIDINTGKSRDLPGGWGGANYNDPREIDFAGKAVSIPAGGAIIIGTEGHPRTMATIYVNPEMIAAMLPAGPEVSDRDKMILRSIRSYTSAGRKEIFRDQKVKPEEVDALVGRGLLKKTKSGALSITTDGKNMAEGENPMRSLLNRLESLCEAEASGFATSKDIERAGYDQSGDDFKPNVPAVVKSSMTMGSASVDKAIKEGGVFTFRKSYFYKGGENETSFSTRVEKDLKRVGLVPLMLSAGDHWGEFKGGSKAFSKNDSFFFAVFQVRKGA